MFVEHFSGISSDNDFLCNECQENLYCEADDDNCSIFITKSKFPSFNLDESIFYTNEITNYKKVNEQISTDYNKSENTTFSLYEKESEQISIISNQTGPENNKESDDIKDLAHLLPNNNNTKQNVRYKIIPEEKKKFMGRKRRNDESNRKKSWDNQMDVWKNIRVKINKSLHSILNEFSKKYGFNKFFSFNGKISTKKDVNEILLNENIKNYIIRQGISNNFNKGKTEDEKEKNNKNNLNLICKILQFENNLDKKPFTEFVNMNFKDFYENIFLNKENNDINILYQNKFNFYLFIKTLDDEKKNVYETIATTIYKIFKEKKSRTPKIKNCK